jgi:tetratricopeptide (TPR) repeat protein
LELDPQDYETWFAYAHQLKNQGRLAEARKAMARGVSCPAVKEHPDLLLEMCFQLGVLHEGAREFDKAAAAFREAVKLLDKPEALLQTGSFDRREIEVRAADLWERIGRAAVQAKKYDEAVKAFLEAKARTKEGPGRLNLNLAEVYRAQGKYQKAIEAVDAYLALQPQGLEAYELKIDLLRRLGCSKAEILARLKTHADKDRYNVGLRLLLAGQYQKAEQYADAKEIYDDLAKGTPNPEVYRGLFHLYLKAKHLGTILGLLDETFREAGKDENGRGKTAAAARAQAMLAVLKDDKDLIKPLLEDAAEYLQANRRLEYGTCRVLAVLAGRAHQLETAERLYRRCLYQLGPENEAIVYGGLLRVLWEGHKYRQIVELCEKGLEGTRHTNHLMFHLDLAQALPYLGQMKKAIEHADQAVALAGEDNRLYARLRRVGVLTQAGQYQKATRECEALLKEFSQPGDAHDIRYMLSGVYTAARNFSKAEKELQRLIKTNPDDATAYNDLGYIWADQGKNLKEAESFIRKAIKLDRKQKEANHLGGTEDGRDNAAYVDSLGWVLFRRGQINGASRELEKATSLPGGDDDPVVWDHLGDVYSRLSQLARARSCWQTAVRLFDQGRRKKDQRYEEIKHKLETLNQEIQP